MDQSLLLPFFFFSCYKVRAFAAGAGQGKKNYLLVDSHTTILFHFPLCILGTYAYMPGVSQAARLGTQIAQLALWDSAALTITPTAGPRPGLFKGLL